MSVTVGDGVGLAVGEGVAEADGEIEVDADGDGVDVVEAAGLATLWNQLNGSTCQKK